MLAAENIPADDLIELVRGDLAVAGNERLEDEDGAVEVTRVLDHRGGRAASAGRNFRGNCQIELSIPRSLLGTPLDPRDVVVNLPGDTRALAVPAAERCLLIAGVDHLHTAILGGEGVGWVFKLLEAVPNRHQIARINTVLF